MSPRGSPEAPPKPGEAKGQTLPLKMKKKDNKLKKDFTGQIYFHNSLLGIYFFHKILVGFYKNYSPAKVDKLIKTGNSEVVYNLRSRMKYSNNAVLEGSRSLQLPSFVFLHRAGYLAGSPYIPLIKQKERVLCAPHSG